MRFAGGSEGKASAYNAGDPGSIPGSGGCPGEENGNPLRYSCLDNLMDTVHRVAKSWTRLSDFTFTKELFKKLALLQCQLRTSVMPGDQ